MAEGAFRVGAVPLLQAGPHHVPGGGDCPGGHHPSQGRGAAGQGAALPRLALRHPSREGRGVAQGDDPAGEGPLRRHPGQARQPGLPPARGAAVHPAAGPERRGRVAQPGHVQHRPALPLLAAGPGHPQRHPLRHRHAGLLPGGLRPLGRHAPQREHGGAGPLRLWKILCHQAGNAAGPDEGSDRLRHRPGGRVRGHGPRRRRQGAVPRSAGRGHEPLRHRQRRLRGDAPAHWQPETAHRGDGGGEPRRGAQGLPRPRPSGLLRPAPGAHRLPRFLPVSARGRGWRRGSGPAAQAIRHRQPASPALRRGRRPAGQRGPRHRLRPAPLGAGAAAGRRDGLHRDGVGRGSAGPQAPAAGRRRGVVDHAAPRRRGLHGQRGEAGAQAPPGVAVHHPGRAGPAQRGHLSHHHRPLRARPASERRLQAAPPAGRRRHQHRGRRLRPAPGPPAMAPVVP